MAIICSKVLVGAVISRDFSQWGKVGKGRGGLTTTNFLLSLRKWANWPCWLMMASRSKISANGTTKFCVLSPEMNQLTMASINHFKRHCRLYSVEITLCSRISTFVVWQQLCLVFFSSSIIPKITLAHLIPFTELTGLNDNFLITSWLFMRDISLTHMSHLSHTGGTWVSAKIQQAH